MLTRIHADVFGRSGSRQFWIETASYVIVSRRQPKPSASKPLAHCVVGILVFRAVDLCKCWRWDSTLAVFQPFIGPATSAKAWSKVPRPGVSGVQLYCT